MYSQNNYHGQNRNEQHFDGHHSGNSHGNGGNGGKRPLPALSNTDYIFNLKTLRIYSQEVSVFITYLTLALQNISNILGCDLSNQHREETLFQNASDDAFFRLANFLWLFRSSEPKLDYGKGEAPEYKEKAKAITKRLWILRNSFVHSEEYKDGGAFICNNDFARFVEGELYLEARSNGLGELASIAKVAKLRIFSPHGIDKGKKDFTRKGIIFLICLALYKHEAEEFIAQFDDLKLPPSSKKIEQERLVITNDELTKLRKRAQSNRGLEDAFTYFSIRSGRKVIDLEDADYINFANILSYLNKVPTVAYNYLSLDEEAKRLQDVANISTESDENKRFKYVLQERKKDRFLSLAIAYIEDFNKLSPIKFKRLDITIRPERKRYIFGRIENGTNELGEPISDANGMDRHYAICNGAIGFEFVPEKHYGSIKIARLRGAITEDEIMRLLLVMHSNIKRQDPYKKLEEYLTAYHRILERMLNTENTDDLSLDDPIFRKDFKTISNGGDEIFEGDFIETMRPYISTSITRYFVKKSLEPSVEELQLRLLRKVEVKRQKATDFITRVDTGIKWRTKRGGACDNSNEKKKGFHSPDLKELNFPPRTVTITENEKIWMVLDCIKLFMDKGSNLRQLPRYARHREEDTEFQILQAMISRFGQERSNKKNFLQALSLPPTSENLGKWEKGFIERHSELSKLFIRMKNIEKSIRANCAVSEAAKKRPSLLSLAYAAAAIIMDECNEITKQYKAPINANDTEKVKYLKEDCQLLGVSLGQPLDRDALLRTVLGIADISKWENSYDYENNCKRQEKRTLASAENLIVTQIRVPNGFASRCCEKGTLFNPAFRNFLPYEKGKMQLRKYYDVTPLIDYMSGKNDAKTGIESRNGEAIECYGKEPPFQKADFARKPLNNAIQAILRAERQDKVLLACARDYWNRYLTSERGQNTTFTLSECASIWEFFETSVNYKIGDISIRMAPNDFAKPQFNDIKTLLKELISKSNTSYASPIIGTENEYTFFDLSIALRDLQRKETTIRLKYLPKICALEEKIPPHLLQLPDKIEDDNGKKIFNEEKALAIANALCISPDDYRLICNFSPRLRHPSGKGETLTSFDLRLIDEVLAKLQIIDNIPNIPKPIAATAKPPFKKHFGNSTYNKRRF